MRLFRAVADQAALTIQNTALLEEVIGARQQQRELALAARVQKRLLPATAPVIAGYDCYAITVPSQEVGGDFHDWIELPGGNWGIAVGDVAGKGVPGAILMASVRAALRAQAEHVYELDHMMDRVNAGLVQETEVSEFVTLFYGVLDSRARRLTATSAGHEPAVLVRDGKLRRLTTGGPCWASRAARPTTMRPSSSRAAMRWWSTRTGPAMRSTSRASGLAASGSSIPSAATPCTVPRRLVEEIHWDIRRFTGLAPRADDLTLLAVKVL